VVAVGLVASVASTSRIFGKDWYYLTLWAWGVAALVALAIGWTAVAFLADRVGPDRRARVTRAVTVGLTGLVAVGSLGLAVGAVNTDPPDSRLSTTMAAVLPDTVAALERGEGPATGRDGRYMVFFSDTMYFGSQAYAIVDELERKGFDVGMPDLFHVPVTRQRVVNADGATAAIVIANGKNIEHLREQPGAVEVAHVDPRDDAGRAEYARVRAALMSELERDGLDELLPHVDGNLYALAIDPRVSESILRKTARLLELGSPTAVFLAPADVAV